MQHAREIVLATGSGTRPAARIVAQAASVLLVCAGYYVGGIIGIALRFPPSGIATIWPSTAILLGVLLLTPPRTWWVYLLAAIPTHLHLVAYFQPGVPIPVQFVQVGANCVHSVVGALLFRGVSGKPARFDTLGRMSAWVLLAAILSTVIACALAVALLVATNWATDFWLALRQRVLANVFAIITIPPLIVLTARGELVGAQNPRLPRYVELGILNLALLAVGMLVFGRETPATPNMTALVLAPVPFLLWAAVRLGPGGLCTCLLVIAAVSFSNAFAGRGPFVTRSPAENTLSMQIFLLALSVPLMILTAIVEERRRAEEEARREREKLAHALRVATLGELTASLAHEINQPLAAIMANAQAARALMTFSPAGGPPVEDALGDIAVDAMRASQVIQRLRTLVRKKHFEPVAVDINQLIEDVVGLLHSEIVIRRIVVRFVRAESLPSIRGDPVLLQQVVLNVIVNACEAIDATKAGPRTITIETTRQGASHTAITISDTGVGVKPPELERIFEHFVSGKPQGLGMGLAICRSIVQAHQGRIWASANANAGITMHIEFPVDGHQVPRGNGANGH
jgi:signal transduction histidine kinase